MSYYPKNNKVPEGFSTSEFVIRPLLAIDVEKDYNAVMATQKLNLRLTEGRWPKNGFTMEDNLEDLKFHQKMHEERKEFTFTVMDPREQHCLGCIYFNPFKPELVSELISEFKIDNLDQDYVSVLFFWLRPDMTTKQFELRFFDKIREWVDSEWEFNQVYYYIRGNTTLEDRKIFVKVGMEEKFRVDKSIFFA